MIRKMADDSTGRWGLLALFPPVGLAGYALIIFFANYPSYFVPRSWDAALYVMQSRSGSVLLGEASGWIGTMKLGYAASLHMALRIFGDNGAMYLSTFYWLLLGGIVGAYLYRRVGRFAAWSAVAAIFFSPLLSKYAIEAMPTMQSILLFVLVGLLLAERKPLWAGLAAGCLLLTDAKWLVIVMAGSTVSLLYLGEDRPGRGFWRRWVEFFLATAAILAVPMVIHPTYFAGLREFIFGHEHLAAFKPTWIFGLYLWLFGALPAAIFAAAVYFFAWRSDRSQFASLKYLLPGCWLSLFAVLFFSVFNELKAVRLFAVAIPTLFLLYGWAAELIMRRTLTLTRNAGADHSIRGLAIVLSISILILTPVVLYSDGPAKQLTLPSGTDQIVYQFREMGAQEFGCASYHWPLYTYGFGHLRNSFAYWGLKKNDRYLALNMILDYVTLYHRVRFEQVTPRTLAQVWEQRDAYREMGRRIFDVDASFFGSKYYLAEHVFDGTADLLSWLRVAEQDSGRTVVYRFYDSTTIGPADNP